jgi:hypothetical protein
MVVVGGTSTSLAMVVAVERHPVVISGSLPNDDFEFTYVDSSDHSENGWIGFSKSLTSKLET